MVKVNLCIHLNAITSHLLNTICLRLILLVFYSLLKTETHNLDNEWLLQILKTCLVWVDEYTAFKSRSCNWFMLNHFDCPVNLNKHFFFARNVYWPFKRAMDIMCCCYKSGQCKHYAVCEGNMILTSSHIQTAL